MMLAIPRSGAPDEEEVVRGAFSRRLKRIQAQRNWRGALPKVLSLNRFLSKLKALASEKRHRRSHDKRPRLTDESPLPSTSQHQPQHAASTIEMGESSQSRPHHRRGQQHVMASSSGAPAHRHMSSANSSAAVSASSIRTPNSSGTLPPHFDTGASSSHAFPPPPPPTANSSGAFPPDLHPATTTMTSSHADPLGQTKAGTSSASKVSDLATVTFAPDSEYGGAYALSQRGAPLASSLASFPAGRLDGGCVARSSLDDVWDPQWDAPLQTGGGLGEGGGSAGGGFDASPSSHLAIRDAQLASSSQTYQTASSLRQAHRHGNTGAAQTSHRSSRSQLDPSSTLLASAMEDHALRLTDAGRDAAIPSGEGGAPGGDGSSSWSWSRPISPPVPVLSGAARGDVGANHDTDDASDDTPPWLNLWGAPQQQSRTLPSITTAPIAAGAQPAVPLPIFNRTGHARRGSTGVLGLSPPQRLAELFGDLFEDVPTPKGVYSCPQSLVPLRGGSPTDSPEPLEPHNGGGWGKGQGAGDGGEQERATAFLSAMQQAADKLQRVVSRQENGNRADYQLGEGARPTRTSRTPSSLKFRNSSKWSDYSDSGESPDASPLSPTDRPPTAHRRRPSTSRNGSWIRRSSFSRSMLRVLTNRARDVDDSTGATCNPSAATSLRDFVMAVDDAPPGGTIAGRPFLSEKFLAYMGKASTALGFAPPGDESAMGRWRRVRQQVWQVMTDATSSRFAYCLSIFLLSFILVSTIGIILESMPQFERGAPRDRLELIEVISVSVFTAELGLKLGSCPSYRRLLRDPIIWIDFVAILPFYLERMFAQISAGSTRTLRVVRLARIFRVLKLGGRCDKVLIVARVLWDSVDVLFMMALLLLIAVLIWSTLVYFAERGKWDAARRAYVREGESEPSPYQDIPETFWFTIVTLTTVGYGDMAPKSIAGRIIAALAMSTAVVVLALPIAVIGGSFATQWAEYVSRPKRKSYPEKFIELDQMLDEHRQVLEDLLRRLNQVESEVDELIVRIRETLLMLQTGKHRSAMLSPRMRRGSRKTARFASLRNVFHPSGDGASRHNTTTWSKRAMRNVEGWMLEVAKKQELLLTLISLTRQFQGERVNTKVGACVLHFCNVLLRRP
eukprot:jgi/Mesvir1/5227/Mv15355-RA.2